jgi:aminomethyltransferase
VRGGDRSRLGELTSGNFSPVLERGIAMALLAPEVKLGDRVEVDLRGRGASAEVVKMPFVGGKD